MPENHFFINDKKILSEIRTMTEHKHFVQKKLACHSYDNAILQPFRWIEGKACSGIISADGAFIDNTNYFEQPTTPYPFDHKDVNIVNDTVIFIGSFVETWGHIFTDGFAKLWYLDTEDCKGRLQNGQYIIYTTTDNHPMPKHILRMFEIAGYDFRKFVHITQLTQFESVIVPDNSFFVDKKELDDRKFTLEYQLLINRIRTKFTFSNQTFPEKVYFTRTRLNQRYRDYGEEQVEKLFRKKGYLIIAPEEHSVDEQLQILCNCKAFAATEGSVSINSIFCQPGTKILVLKKASYSNKYQSAIGDVSDLDTTYIDCFLDTYCNKEKPWEGPFFIYPSKNLQKAIGTNIICGFLFFNLEWWRYQKEHNKFARYIICFLKVLFRIK